MGFVEFYRDFFNYDRWANRRLGSALRELGDHSGDPLKLYAHIMSAQLVWLARILQADYESMETWMDLSLDESESLAEQMHARWNQFLDSLSEEGLDIIIAYNTTSGIPFETSVRDILTHVNNHSTHHRAQIARIIKERGGKSPVMDYIIYVRETRQSGE